MILIFSHNELYAQEKTNLNKNKLGISFPFIWNNSNGVYYALGSRKEPEGKAASYGANINYTHYLQKNIFFTGGIGIFRQRFNIQRPFQYDAGGREPVVVTDKYSYQNLHLLIGLGYQKMVSEKWSIAGQISYNIFHSFKQKYEQSYMPGINEDYKKHFMLGSMVNLDLKCERYLNNRVSIGAAIILPVYTQWNDDKIFYKYDYADDTQIIAQTKFSLGANLSLFYKLKK